MTAVSRILYCALFGSGLVIAALALFGPIHGPIPLRTPLNGESWFVVSGVLLLLLRRSGSLAPSQPWRAGKLDVLYVAAVGLITVFVFAGMAQSYFLSDDFVLLRHARSPWNWHTLFETRGADGFFRPLGYLSYIATEKWAGVDAAIWHWIGFALHALTAALVYVFACELGHSRFGAWVAATVFAVHGSHPEAVVWISGRYDLLATFAFLVAAVGFVESWEAVGFRRRVFQAIKVIAMLAAVLTKESADAFPFIAALLLVCYRRHSHKNWSTVAVLFVAAGVPFVYRWILYGGIGGYTGPDGRAMALSINAVAAINGLGFRLWGILAFPINWSTTVGFVLALITFLYLGALASLFAGSSVSRHTVFALAFIPVAALPALSLILIGMNLEKSRVLYLPSIGFCLLLSAMLEPLGRRSQIVIAAVVILFHSAALWHNLNLWREASRVVQAACQEVAKCDSPSREAIVQGLPNSLNGVYAFQNGFSECIAMQHDNPVSEPAISSCRFIWDPTTASVHRLTDSSPPR